MKLDARKMAVPLISVNNDWPAERGDHTILRYCLVFEPGT